MSEAAVNDGEMKNKQCVSLNQENVENTRGAMTPCCRTQNKPS